MRYIAAYLLANIGDYENPTADNISKILSSVGIDCQKDKAEAVIAELAGKSIEEVISSGSSKLASVPTGGAAAPVATSAAAPAAGSKKEEKKEEKKPESDEEMGFGLFD